MAEDWKGKWILRYEKEAEPSLKGWEEQSLPIGNGFQGANIFGGKTRETIYLSEESLWTGGPVAEGGIARYDNDDFLGLTNRFGKTINHNSINKARQAGLGTDNKKITEIFDKEILPSNRKALGAFQSFAICNIDFFHKADVEDYSRTLNIGQAVATVEYRQNSTIYKREFFASYPKRVIVIHLSAKGDKLNFLCTVTIPHINNENPQTLPQHFLPEDYGKVIDYHVVKENNTIELVGHLKQNGLRFGLIEKIITNGKCEQQDKGILVKDADEADIYISLGTDYVNDYHKRYRTGTNPIEIVAKRIDTAVKCGYDRLRKEHIEDYSSIFEKSALFLYKGEPPTLPTDKIIKRYPHTKFARYLEELYFQYGRYLLIASSREGTLPANLQGVWNAYQFPPWSSDYHLNINLQMNYWHAMRTNMPETVLPLLDYIERLKESGKICAKTLFGIDSWCFMLVSNIFGFVGLSNTWNLQAGGFPTWAQTSFAWMCHSIFEIFLYYGNDRLLKERIFPLLCDCVEFYSKILVYDCKSDRYVLSPSYSAEHGGMFSGCTFEQELVWQIFEDYLYASEYLNMPNSSQFEKIKILQAKLQPLSINKKNGCIKEWYNENVVKIPDIELKHRHISHLVGLFPCSHISMGDTELINAAKKTLKLRGNKGTGWSRAFKIGLNARLGDSKRAYACYRNLLTNCTLPNMWDTHPPFQIDGNFGGVAGVAEMLLYNEKGMIYPLPALPKQWQNGIVKGLMAYSGITVDIEWQKALPIYLNFRAERNISTTINLSHFKPYYAIIHNKTINLVNGKLKINLEKGVDYKIQLFY